MADGAVMLHSVVMPERGGDATGGPIMTYDVAVVGGGPAGTTAARQLAAAGARVVLLEKETYPRFKACAGGITPRTRALLAPVLGEAWSRVSLARVSRVVLWARGLDPLCFAVEGALWETVSREVLDQALMRRAEAAGAEVRWGSRVTGVRREKGLFRVQAPDEELAARAVIGADGARGVVARALGIGGWPEAAAALVTEVPEAARGPGLREVAWIDNGAVPGGYAWVIPKGEQVSVGITGQVPFRQLHPALAEFARRHGLNLDAAATGPRGWLLPVWQRYRPVAAGCALIVGDAAGLVDPLTGEGIYSAVRSGELAASALLAHHFDPRAGEAYVGMLNQSLRRDLAWASLLRRLTAERPEATQRWLAQFPVAFHWLYAVPLGHCTYGQLTRRVVGMWRSDAFSKQ